MTNTVIDRMELVFKKEDMERIKAGKNGEITVDLHGLGTKESIVLLNNIININMDSCKIRVIHGYNHGVALKDMVNQRFCNQRITERFTSKKNPGITILSCAATF